MIGAVMVPVNSRFVAEEIKYILNHSEARVLVTAERHLDVIEALRRNLAHLELVINIDKNNKNNALPYARRLDNQKKLKGADKWGGFSRDPLHLRHHRKPKRVHGIP